MTDKFAFALLLSLSVWLTAETVSAAPAAAAESPMVHEAVIDGPPTEVWRLLTTKEGMESWIVPHAEVDFRVGGLLRTNHDPDGTIGDAKTTTNRILAIQPGKKVSVQVAGVPRGYPFAGAVEGTWYEVSLSPRSRGQTIVRCVGHGFGQGPMEFAARSLVDRGSVWALERLQKVFADRKAADHKVRARGTP